MNKKEPLPIDNTGTGKLGSIRVLTKKEKKIQKECIKQLNKYLDKKTTLYMMILNEYGRKING